MSEFQKAQNHSSVYGEPEGVSAGFEYTVDTFVEELHEEYEQYIKDILADPDEVAKLKTIDRSNEGLHYAACEVAAYEVSAHLDEKYRDCVQSILFCG